MQQSLFLERVLKKLSQEDVTLIFELHGCKLLGEYLGSGIPVNYQCKCGKTAEISLDKFKRRIARKEGCFYCSNHEWTQEEDIVLREMYGKEPRSVIAKKLGVTLASIKSRAAVLGLKGNRSLVARKTKKGKYSHDVEFFDKRNSVSLYWAGFIAANGSIVRDKNTVTVRSKNLGHIEKFQDIACHTGVIHKLDKHILFTVHGAHQWIDRLENIDICNMKEREALAYIAGYLDGDICIVSGESIQILGSEQMLLWIKSWFDKWCPPFYGRVANVNKKSSKKFSYSIKGVRAKYLAEKLLEIDVPRLSSKWCIKK